MRVVRRQDGVHRAALRQRHERGAFATTIFFRDRVSRTCRRGMTDSACSGCGYERRNRNRDRHKKWSLHAVPPGSSSNPDATTEPGAYRHGGPRILS
jgi:hypothetical protein